MGVTVYCGTYGADRWAGLAWNRARASIPRDIPWVHSHGPTLHEARNKALASVETEWCLLLDADDELEPGYIDAMKAATADVRAPMVRYCKSGSQRLWQPRVAGHKHDCKADCLREGNWIVCGAMVRTELVREIGGWADFPWSEDWATWARCYTLGATFELVRDAVYRAHVRSDSRNRGATHEEKMVAHRMIEKAVFGEVTV